MRTHHQPCWYPIGFVMCIAIPAPSLRGQWICSQNEGAAMCSRVVQRQAGRMEHRYLLDRNNQEEPAVVEAGCHHALKKCIAGRSDPLLQRVWRPIRRSSRTRGQHGPPSKRYPCTGTCASRPGCPNSELDSCQLRLISGLWFKGYSHRHGSRQPHRAGIRINSPLLCKAYQWMPAARGPFMYGRG